MAFPKVILAHRSVSGFNVLNVWDGDFATLAEANIINPQDTNFGAGF